MKCSICEEQITADPFGWKGGCNAHPINDGICCYKCDNEVVIPRRFKDAGIDPNSPHYFIPNFPIELIKERK